MTELLSPAGDLEKLKYAVVYGADSVYFAGKAFGMRANAGNFSNQDIAEGVEFAHKHNVKTFVTVNIAARNDDFAEIEKYLKELSSLGADGLIIADPGVIALAKQTVPEMFITLSTQANTTNANSVAFWYNCGVNRVVLARELGFKEISEICKVRPKGMQIETFIHGSMCISYSGRCLLSNYLAGRDANRGDCAQPCRWEYQIREVSRTQWNDITEDNYGTYIMNSKDLCLIDKVPELIAAGVDSFKIEGRMKSYYYTACVTNAYRRAIDRAKANINSDNADLYDELLKVSHREYTHAFYESRDDICQNYKNGGYERPYTYIAQVSGETEQNGYTRIIQKNKFYVHDTVEVISPDGCNVTLRIEDLCDEEMIKISDAPHPNETLYIKTAKPLKKYSLIRKKLTN